MGAFLKAAYQQACCAFRKGEVPVGAVVVREGVIISRAHNLKEKRQDSMAHAEVLALQKAMKKLGTWHLDGCDLYTTLEPCPMCAGAIVQARIKNVYYGILDPKGGGVSSLLNLFDVPGLNHRVAALCLGDVACGEILSRFFKELRASRTGRFSC